MKSKILTGIIIAALYACNGEGATKPEQEQSISSSSIQSTRESSSSRQEINSSSDATKDSLASISSSSSKQDLNTPDQETSSSSLEVPVSSSSKIVVNNYDPVTGILTDERDGQTYKTAKIGDQIWMGENLRYLNPVSAENSCHGVEENVADSILTFYGRHYSWIAAMNLPCEYCHLFAYSATDTPIVKPPHQGLCPTGWHVPSVEDWQELFNHATLNSLLGKDWTEEDHGLVGTDDYGFSLHAARFEVEDFPRFHLINERDEYGGYALAIYDDRNPIHTRDYPKAHIETYLRCLKD